MPLANGGVLALEGEVAGDTSKSTDDHLAGCQAAERDDEWLLEITEAGPYVFRIETPGWDAPAPPPRDPPLTPLREKRAHTQGQP